MELDITLDESVPVNLDFTTAQSSPPAGLTATPVGAGGTFAAGNYFWEVTALTALGETTVSNEATAAIVLNGSCVLNWNAPNNVVTGYKLYRGTAAGAENVLVATIPAGTTTFNDTNLGGAGAPPGTNTATIQDYILLTGYAQYSGYAFSETSGTAAAWVEILDNTNRLAECRLPSSGSETEGSPGQRTPINGYIKVHVNSGAVRGTVYARIPPVNC